MSILEYYLSKGYRILIPVEDKDLDFSIPVSRTDCATGIMVEKI